MITTITSDKNQHAAEIRQLFQEYLQWANARVYEEFGMGFNTNEWVESTISRPGTI